MLVKIYEINKILHKPGADLWNGAGGTRLYLGQTYGGYNLYTSGVDLKLFQRKSLKKF